MLRLLLLARTLTSGCVCDILHVKMSNITRCETAVKSDPQIDPVRVWRKSILAPFVKERLGQKLGTFAVLQVFPHISL